MFESIYKKRQRRGYADKIYSIEDSSPSSDQYFNVKEIPSVLTAGKNVIKLGLDGPKLKASTDVDIEVLDADGNSLYIEYADYKDRFGYYYFAVYVYDLMPAGIGSIDIVGTALYTPTGRETYLPASEHVFEHNVRWRTLVDIRPTERNVTDIHFQKSPKVTVSQVLVPYKFNVGTYNINTKLTTRSIDELTIVNTRNVGFDVKMNTSEDILDIEDLRNTYNYFQESSTANIVQTNIRKYHREVVDGYVYSEYFRHGAILKYQSTDPKAFDTAPFTKDMEGSLLSFADIDNGVSMITKWLISPASGSLYEIRGGSGSLPTQYTRYTPKIVSVINGKQAILSHAPTIDIIDKSGRKGPVERELEISKLQYAVGNFAYPTSTQEEIESISLSSSYLQFTITDFKPIVGDVYRIKTYIKEAGANTEYNLINDHIVKAPEYLIDTDKTNQAVYVKNQSDFFLYGEFTGPEVASEYWRGFFVSSSTRLEQYSFINSASYSPVTNFPLANSIKITNTGSYQRGLFTRYFQTYLPNEPYSLSFYCMLDPGCELEVYMSSTTLKETQDAFQAPKAFKQSPNYYPSGSRYSKFGKLIGKVKNLDSTSRKFYDNVVFDFYSEDDGFGRPLFLLKTYSTSSLTAYISSVSITPLDLVGYTPSILQYAAPTPDTLSILQDDEAHLSQSVDVKLEYYTSDGKQSEYVTYIPNLVLNMLNETPGFCASELSSFDNQCPLYYEIGTDPSHETVKPNLGTSSLEPRLYEPETYFWPTFSLNNYAGYSWNMWSFRIGGDDYMNDFEWVQPSTASIFWMTPATATITSSWFRYDPFLPLYNATIPTTNPADILGLMYSHKTDPFNPQRSFFSAAPVDQISTNADTRPFYLGDGVALDKFNLAYKHETLLGLLPSSNVYEIQQNPTALGMFDEYLKSSRLYYPATTSIYEHGFFENGGVYNVKFKITTAPEFNQTYRAFNDVDTPGHNTPINANNDITQISVIADNTRFTPDKGAKLMVYIADVASALPSNKLIVPGVGGFFPPKSNIVTIGNFYGGMPEMVFFDSGSGYRTDVYDLILVQYGEQGQLVFDASGLEFELDTDPAAYSGSYKVYHNVLNKIWGGIITDIEWCKIGTTTDARFLKPTNFDSEVSKYVQKRGQPRSLYIDPDYPVDPKLYWATLTAGDQILNNWQTVRPYYQIRQTNTLGIGSNITDRLTQTPPSRPPDYDVDDIINNQQ